MERFERRLTLTAEELLDGYTRAQLRRASKGRLWVQTAILLLCAAWCLIAYFADGMNETMSLVIGVAALMLIPVMWAVPPLQLRTVARTMVENEEFARLWVFEDGVSFGDSRPDGADFAFGTFACDQNEQSLVLRFAGDEVVVVPHRLFSDDEWQFLCEQTAGVGIERRQTRRR